MKRFLSIVLAGSLIGVFALLMFSQVPAALVRSGIIIGNSSAQSGGTVPTSGWSAVNGVIYNDFPTPQTLGFNVLDSGSTNLRFVSQPVVAIPYTWITTVRFFDPGDQNTQLGGIYLSDGTKAIGFEIVNQSANNNQLRVQQYVTVNTNGTTQAGPTMNLTAFSLVSFRIVNDGTHRTYSYYSAGAWVQFFQEATGTWLTETAAGVGGLSIVGNAGFQVSGEIVGWSLH